MGCHDSKCYGDQSGGESGRTRWLDMVHGKLEHDRVGEIVEETAVWVGAATYGKIKRKGVGI